MNDRRYDVLVAGGGAAGFAAAITAARRGAHTVLLERADRLGGNASLALVHTICGLYQLDGERPVPVNPGFAHEFADRLLAANAARPAEKMGRLWVLPTQPEGLALTAAALSAAEKNLTILFNATLHAADGDTVTYSTTQAAPATIRAATWIDATGDASLAQLAGAACEITPPDHLQRPAYIFSLRNVNTDALDADGRIRLAARIAAAVRAGNLPPDALGAAFRPSGNAGEIFATLDLAAPGYDPASATQTSALYQQASALADTLTRFLLQNIPAFSAARPGSMPAQIGVRESRRLIGDARLTGEAILRSEQPPDAVAQAAWPIELRETHHGPRWRFPDSGQPAGIPLGALRWRGQPRRYIVGRCISCDHEAQASVRVIGTALAMGEAAAVAAVA